MNGKVPTADQNGDATHQSIIIRPLAEVLKRLAVDHLRYSQVHQLALSLGAQAPQNLILRLLGDPNPRVRQIAASAMGVLCDPLSPASIDPLLSCIDDLDDRVAAAAIHTLGLKQIMQAKAQLLDCVMMSDDGVAAAALNALSRIDLAMAIDRLDAFLLSNDRTRIEAAANIIKTHQLADRYAAVVDAFESLSRDDRFVARANNAEINPENLRRSFGWNRRRNQWITLIQTITELEYEAPDRERLVAALQNTALNVIGLRTHAIRALQKLNVDVLELAKIAFKTHASNGLYAIIERLDPATSLQPKPHQRVLPDNNLAGNLDLLKLRGRRLESGESVVGSAKKVLNNYAIIGLSEGFHALLHLDQMHWTQLKSLKPCLEFLTGQVDYRILHSCHSTGFITVSHRATFEDPWCENNLFFEQDLPGKIVTFLSFGLLISVGNGCVGFLHISKLGLQDQDDMMQHYKLGDRLKVRIETIDRNLRKVSLRLAGQVASV